MIYLDEGHIPVITCSTQWNGIAGYFDVPEEHIQSNCITITANGDAGVAFFHPYPFAAGADVLICKWNDAITPTPALALYVCNAITHNSWRYDYYRKLNLPKLKADVRLTLPVVDGRIDYETIEQAVSEMPGYSQLVEMIGD